MEIAITGAISSPASLGASVCIAGLLLAAYQHFSPMCPGSRSRRIACDPGCAAHTASALERHSAWAVGAVAIKTARTRGMRIIAPRYALHSGCCRSEKTLIENGLKISFRSKSPSRLGRKRPGLAGLRFIAGHERASGDRYHRRRYVRPNA